MLELASAVDQPVRSVLDDEVHTRPPDNLPKPRNLEYLASVPTVEGLSLAAVTTCSGGLAGTLSKAAAAFGVDPIRDLVAAVRIPPIAAACLSNRQRGNKIHEGTD